MSILACCSFTKYHALMRRKSAILLRSILKLLRSKHDITENYIRKRITKIIYNSKYKIIILVCITVSWSELCPKWALLFWRSSIFYHIGIMFLRPLLNEISILRYLSYNVPCSFYCMFLRCLRKHRILYFNSNLFITSS